MVVIGIACHVDAVSHAEYRTLLGGIGLRGLARLNSVDRGNPTIPPGHHASLAPLLARTEIALSNTPDSGMDAVHLRRAGNIEINDELVSSARDDVVLRYGLEFAWLSRLPELGIAAASILAARAAGSFAAHIAQPTSDSSLANAFATLTNRAVDPVVLQAAAHRLDTTHGGDSLLSSYDLACCEALWPLVLPTECLLASGGDDRLTLDPETGLNRYGCAPWPRAETIAFSSCTASSLSVEAFEAAELARQSLVAATLRTAPSVALAEASDEIGASLLAYFGVADLAEAVLAASGTDAALVATGLLAAERPGQKLTSILMSPSETGSGVPDAVQGRHFATSAAAGCKVGKGQPIEGLTSGPDLVTVALRQPSGEPRSVAEVGSACESAIRAGIASGHVVLHAIDGSKTGLTAPDRATCRRLSATYGSALDIVVDACQARMEPALVRWYLQQGFPVLVTGSKFFGAPGFCGAVLFPRARLQRIARHGRLPAGLAPYARLEGGFGSRRCPGLVLRWRAALHQMNAFAAVPAHLIRRRLDSIGQAVLAGLQTDGRLRLVSAPRLAGPAWSGRRSVFTFAVRATDRWMSPAELRPLYAALGSDISRLDLAGQRELVLRRCQIGQPVELGNPALGGLRIAISAAQLSVDYDYRADLTIVVGKLLMLMDNMAAKPSFLAVESPRPDRAGQRARAALRG